MAVYLGAFAVPENTVHANTPTRPLISETSIAQGPETQGANFIEHLFSRPQVCTGLTKATTYNMCY